MNTATFVTLALLVTIASAGLTSTSFTSFFTSATSFFSSFFTSATSFFSSFTSLTASFTSLTGSFTSLTGSFSSGGSGSSFASALVPAVGIVCGAVVAMI